MMIIIEGIDGTGKTTLKDKLLSRGFRSLHFDYDVSSQSIFDKYDRIIQSCDDEIVLDRSFISEVAYGNAVRSGSRITPNQLDELAYKCAKKGTIIVYLHAPKEILSSRRIDDAKDANLLEKYYKRLCEQYESIMRHLAIYLPVLWLDATLPVNDLIDALCDFYVEEKFELVYVGNISRDVEDDGVSSCWGGSAFHSAVASALTGNKRIGLISGIGNDFDITIMESLSITNINEVNYARKCNSFRKDPITLNFVLLESSYVEYPQITKRVFADHIHISLRYGVPVERIIENPLLRYGTLSFDVLNSSLSYAIEMLERYKHKLSLLFCNFAEFQHIQKSKFLFTVIVTNEHRPVSIWANGILQQMLIVPYNPIIVRTDGAGDSFIGGFLSLPLKIDNLSSNTVLGIATAWASVSCEKRYKLSSETLHFAKIKTECANTVIIKRLPKHIIVVGNSCSGKSELSNYIIDYLSNHYEMIDDYNCLNDIFGLDDAIRASLNISDLLKYTYSNSKAHTVISEYRQLLSRGTLTNLTLYTTANSAGGHDIQRPELWDVILADSLSEVFVDKHYIVQLSRGADESYLNYKSIKASEVYDSALMLLIEKFKCNTEDILLINMTADYDIRIARNILRAAHGGHLVSEEAMKTVYAEDVLQTRCGSSSGWLTVENYNLPYVTVYNNENANNLDERFHEITMELLIKYNQSFNS